MSLIIPPATDKIGNIFAYSNEPQGYGDDERVSNKICYTCWVKSLNNEDFSNTINDWTIQ